ncbi:glycine cleavage system protein H [Pseudonocardia sp. CNS-004]|nr:glycine cleavage system protein H [Pseudonocardia sp. CNS-004]
MIREELHYTAEHEWVLAAGADLVRIGITDYAQNQLGDVVFVELPDVGTAVKAGDAFGEVESTKSRSDLVAPVTGEVVAVNADLAEQPELVNSDPYGTGWMLELRVDGRSEDAVVELLDAAGYAKTIA